MLITSATIDNYSVIILELLKEYLGVDYKWGIQYDSKVYWKAIIGKNLTHPVQKCEEHIRKEHELSNSAEKHHKNLSKNEGKTIEIDDCRSNVGLLMLFTRKFGPKLSNATIYLSGFMSSPVDAHWEALGRVTCYLKTMKVKGILCAEPELHKIIGFADAYFGISLKLG